MGQSALSSRTSFFGPSCDELARWLVKKWGLPKQTADFISLGACGNVRQALLDAADFHTVCTCTLLSAAVQLFPGVRAQSLPQPAIHSYEVQPRKDKRDFDLISDAMPFGGLWYGEPDAIGNAVDYAKFYSRSHSVAIRVFDEWGTVIETHEHAGDFQEP